MVEGVKSRQSLPVYRSNHFVATDGVAEGDGISFADELILDDVYQLRHAAKRQMLRLNVDGQDGFKIAGGSAIGIPGSIVVLDCCITLMATDGTTLEALILVELQPDGVEDVYFLPLAELHVGADYRLVGLDRHAATKRLAEVACVSFSRGTNITMASGLQVPIEDLKVGDMVLTRDDGPQPVRWVGQTTLRAVGEFAPVMIKKGTLHNVRDLMLSPDHRIFVYQREDKLGAGRSEVLIKVRHLMDGETVYQQDGGFVDYFQLLFDDHQIIFAEGIAAESLLIDPRTRAAIPDDAEASQNEHQHRVHLDYEVKENLIPQRDAVGLLRKASF